MEFNWFVQFGLVHFVRFSYEYWHCNYIPENDSIFFDENDSLDTSISIAADELNEHAFDDFLRRFNVNESANNEIVQQELHNNGSFRNKTTGK